MPRRMTPEEEKLWGNGCKIGTKPQRIANVKTFEDALSSVFFQPKSRFFLEDMPEALSDAYWDAHDKEWEKHKKLPGAQLTYKHYKPSLQRSGYAANGYRITDSNDLMHSVLSIANYHPDYYNETIGPGVRIHTTPIVQQCTRPWLKELLTKVPHVKLWFKMDMTRTKKDKGRLPITKLAASAQRIGRINGMPLTLACQYLLRKPDEEPYRPNPNILKVYRYDTNYACGGEACDPSVTIYGDVASLLNTTLHWDIVGMPTQEQMVSFMEQFKAMLINDCTDHQDGLPQRFRKELNKQLNIYIRERFHDPLLSNRAINHWDSYMHRLASKEIIDRAEAYRVAAAVS